MHNCHIAETKAIGFGSPNYYGGRTADFGGFFASVRMIHSMGERAGGRKPRLNRSTGLPTRTSCPPVWKRNGKVTDLTTESIMTNLSTRASAPVVSIINNQVVTTSLEVARVFDKRHDNVLRSIEQIVADLKNEASDSNFTESNFGLSEYTDSTGRTLPLVNLTRDGFTLLAMGFTGKRALQFKLAYIAQFNAMEAALKRKSSVHPTPTAIANARKQLTEAVWKKGGIQVDWAQIMPDSEAALGLIGSVLMSSQWLVRFDCATMVPQLYPVPDKALMLTPDQLNERFTELNFTDEQTRALLNKCVDRLYRYKELVDQAQKDITYLVQQKSKLKRN